jgi:hypothetical protein
MAFTRRNLTEAAACILAASFVAARSGFSRQTLPGGVVAPPVALRAGGTEAHGRLSAASHPA